ncbi:MAG: PHP domain-containing protein [Candidatus Omnitrophica bacterium]|nr:PHP domain-containing protein [Candidatus Omnitrophota bacterium]
MEENSIKKCDLHIHSTFSDSDATIEEIFKEAGERQLSCIAITDHDTTGGLEKAREASAHYGIELIDGIEISAQKKDFEVHVLGYYINPKNTAFCEALVQMKKLRRERYFAMVNKLHALGVSIDSERIVSNIANSIPTRLHLGLYLVQKGVVKSLRDAFRKYLSPGKPAYISRFKYSVEEAIALIHSCGGLAFLAHPQLIPDQSWIEEFVACGLDGLEVVYPKFSQTKISLYTNMADKLGLLKSGGSDAHGSYKEYTEVGNVTIPYAWVEKMKERRRIL